MTTTTEGPATGDAGEEQDEVLTGRAAVRAHLVERLVAAGLRRAKGATEAEHARMLADLVDDLAWLSVPSLLALADQIMACAAGPKHDQWPSGLVVRQMAQALEPRPFEQAPIVTSWLASVQGPKAEAGGYLVQLYRCLRTIKRPVLPWDLKGVQDQAVEDRRRLVLIRERRAIGDDRPEDRAWAAAYAEDERLAQAIVDRGNAHRSAKAQGGLA